MRLAKRLTLACSLTAALAAGGASDALASSAGGMLDAPSQRLLVTYTAAPGEANVVSGMVSPNSVRIRDDGATIAASAGCSSVDAHQVDCGPPGLRGMLVQVLTGDLADTVNLAFASQTDLGPGNDTGLGSTQPDLASGGDGNDKLLGHAGDDTFDGGKGDDLVDGDAGNDELSGGSGKDRLLGDSGSDVARSNSGNDRLTGSGGGDRLFGGSGKDRLTGGSAGDRLVGDSGNDRILGESGDDRLGGGSGRDRLSGGSGDDRMSGDAGDDRLNGGAGGDRLNGGKGQVRLSGASGRDYIAAADNERDVVLCGSGDDRVTADHMDVLIGCERVSFRWPTLYPGRSVSSLLDLRLLLLPPRGE